MAFVVVLLSAFHKAHADTSPQRITFEYSYQDPSVVSPRELERKRGWKELDPEKSSLERNEGRTLWLRFTIPPTGQFPDPVIKFFRLHEKFVFFIGDKKISSFGEGKAYAGLPVHLLSVPLSESSSVGYLRLESSLPRIGPRGAVFLGSRAFFINKLVVGDTTDYFVISILGLLGVSGLVLFLYYSSVTTYLNLGGFAVSAGLYFFGRMPSKILFDLDPVWTGFVGLWGLYATPFFFINFFRGIFAIEHNRYFRIVSFVSGFFLAFSLASSLVSPSGPLALLLPFYGFAILTFASAIIFAFSRLRFHRFSSTFYAGISLLFLSGLWEVARELRFFNANIPIITWGFLCFVISLVTMQGQFFASVFDEAKLNARLAEEAKTRLERVLVCTRELSSTRNYKELIRVVADALVTELGLDKQGVSVDFFMPVGSSEKDSEAIHQFSYLFSNSDGESALYEVKQIDSKSSSHEQRASERDKVTSLPGISNAMDHVGSPLEANPSSVLTIPVLSGGFVGAVTVRKYSQGAFHSADFAHLSKFVNSISSSLLIALQNLEYVNEVKAKTLMENELDAAMSLQAALLPEPLVLPGVQYSAYCKSAGKTGGDWHGHYFCQKTQRLFLTVGDVTGHDFAASIMTGLAAGVVKAWEEHDSQQFLHGGLALEDLASLVNRVLCGSNHGLKFMSMFFACIDLSKGELHVVNAGHPHPFHLSPKKSAATIPGSGHLLGQDPCAIYKSETVQLDFGDTIIIYTDGLFENRGQGGECLSRRAMIRSIATTHEAQGMVEAILELAQRVWDSAPPDDDVTLVAVTWKHAIGDSRTEGAA